MKLEVFFAEELPSPVAPAYIQVTRATDPPLLFQPGTRAPGLFSYFGSDTESDCGNQPSNSNHIQAVNALTCNGKRVIIFLPININTKEADRLLYRVNNLSPYSINVLEDETQWSTYSYYAGTYEYRFTVRRNNTWSAWSEPITITVTDYDPLGAPTITTTSSLESGKDLVISLSAVEGATSYELSLQKSDGTVSFNSTIYPQNIAEYSFPGYRLTPGTYTVSAYANNGYVSSQTSQTTITIPATDRPPAPIVQPPENTAIPSGNYATFGINTTGADMIAVRYFTIGNTNDVYYNTQAVTEGSNETDWSIYFSGNSKKYSFAVRKDGIWSEWSGFIAITTQEQ